MASLEDAGIVEQRAGENPPKSKAHSGYTRTRIETAQGRRLRCNVRMKYGAAEIEFGVDAPFDVEDAADQERLWDMLYSQVIDQHQKFAREDLPHIPFLQRQDAGTRKTYECAVLYTDAGQDGVERRRVKTVAGTPYNKWGLTLHDEAQWLNLCKMLNLDEATKFFDLSGVSVDVEEVNGKGKIYGFRLMKPK